MSSTFNPGLPATNDPHPLTAEAMTRLPKREIDHSQVPDSRIGLANKKSRFLEVVEDILRYMEEGNTRANAARLAGVHEDLVGDWAKFGRDNPERYPEYAWFNTEVDRIKAHVQSALVQQIIATAKSGRPNTWQAAAWYLERSDPGNWGRREKVEVENTGDRPVIQLNQVILSDDAAFAASRDLLARLGAGSAAEPLGIGPGRPDPEDIEAA